MHFLRIKVKIPISNSDIHNHLEYICCPPDVCLWAPTRPDASSGAPQRNRRSPHIHIYTYIPLYHIISYHIVLYYYWHRRRCWTSAMPYHLFSRYVVNILHQVATLCDTYRRYRSAQCFRNDEFCVKCNDRCAPCMRYSICACAPHVAVSTLFVTTARTETLNGTIWGVTLFLVLPSLSQKNNYKLTI